MRVLVDAKEMCARSTGLARYERELAARVSQGTDAVLVVRRRAVDDGSASALSGRLVVVSNSWPSLFIDQVVMAVLSWRHRATVIHSLSGRLPMLARRGRRVMTFHEDRASYHIRYPPTGLYARSAAPFQLYIERRSLVRADKVLAISAVSAAAAVSLGAEPSHVEVCHHGVSAAFCPGGRQKLHHKSSEDEVLTLASGDPRDDLDYVLEAVRPLRHRLSVVIAGSVPEKVAQHYLSESSRQGVRMRFLGEVSDEQLATLYARCLSYLHPSTFEGFGLAVVEAMACGAPVIARPSAAITEVAASYATVARRPTDATTALRELLDHPGMRTTLSTAGQQRARQFTWHAAAAVTLAAYQ